MYNSIIIAGCNFIGLYSAIKCIDSGYNKDIIIIEKKSNFIDNKTNYLIFNKNHTLYINLLNKFSIKYTKYILKYNNKITHILNNIINNSKMITKKSLNNQTFIKFCRTILSPIDYNVLKYNIEDFEYIYNNVSAMFAITLFTNELNNEQEYYILEDDKNLLIERMYNYVVNNKVVILFNTEIKDIIYKNKIFILLKNKTYISTILILSLSKDNLLKFKFFSKENRKILNCVSKHNIDIDKIFCDNKIQYCDDIKSHLLNNIHLVCPIKKYNVYLWNVGINEIIIKEKIKQMFNHIYICSDSYSRNSFFANYSLETYDDIHNKVINKIIKK